MEHLKSGTVLKGKYELTGAVRRGLYSSVWCALDNNKEKVAVKTLGFVFDDPTDSLYRPYHHDILHDMVFRLRQEAFILSKLSHPGIPRYIESFEYDGRPVIVMEWVDGCPLGRFENKISAHDLEGYWNKIVPVLSYVHHQGFVHCDVSPNNIMVTPAGDVKLIDFGIADSPMNGKRVDRDFTWGTKEFMSPEQVTAPRLVDYRSDYYSLARTFVYLLSGHSPKNDGWAEGENGLSNYDTAPDVVFRGDICECLENLDGCPPDWQSFLKPYLAKDPKKRPLLLSKGCFLNGHEWVDLGLSVKWATCNVGAFFPEDLGDLFAWGETESKSSFSVENYRFRLSGGDVEDLRFSKYNTMYARGIVDNKIQLDPEDDAARMIWGATWRMPTKDEFQELIENCDCSRENGGTRLTSRINGKVLFLPFTFFPLPFTDGCAYWSSTLFPRQGYGYFECSACYLYHDVAGFIELWYGYRYDGAFIRPVTE